MLRLRFLVTCLIALIVFTIAQSSQSSEEGTGIIYGSDHAFMVTAPSGWVIDNKNGVSQGLWAVFYPVGSSWKDSNVVMYINTASKAGNPTLEGLIAFDLEQQRNESPGIHIISGEPLVLEDGTKVTVNQFSGDRWGNYESVAYIEAPTVWVMIVLTSRNESAYKAALPAFNSLVKTYKFLTTKVGIKK
jgi:hypothetical protein